MVRQAADLPAIPPPAAAAVRPAGLGRACQLAPVADVPARPPPLSPLSFLEFGDLAPLLWGQVPRRGVGHDGWAGAVRLLDFGDVWVLVMILKGDRGDDFKISLWVCMYVLL